MDGRTTLDMAFFFAEEGVRESKGMFSDLEWLTTEVLILGRPRRPVRFPSDIF